MNSTYTIFKTFPDKETAESFADVLATNGITFLIEEDSLNFDPSYAHNPLSREYFLKIRKSDFALATKAYETYFSQLLDKVDEDYYLFSFTTDELHEILAKPDEWGSFDYLLAERLLQQRGIAFSKLEKEAMKATRQMELAKPENETPTNIAGYYVLSVLFFPIGIIIGWIWAYSTKRLPNGEKVRAYNARVQQHGRIIFVLANALFATTVLIRFLQTLPDE